MAKSTTVKPSLADRLIRAAARIAVALDRNLIAGLVVGGGGTVAYGVSMIYVPAGVIAGGLLAMGLGVLLGRAQ